LPTPQPKSPIYQNIGLKLRALREQQGKTQADIAALLGKSAQAYAKYENAENQLSLDALHVLATYYGVTLAELLPEETVLKSISVSQTINKGVAEAQTPFNGTPRDDRLSDAAKVGELMLGLRNGDVRNDLIRLITTIRDS